ncbi:MAG: 2-hydroxyacyl-CoA dehydratase [Clostridia bacterium]|nr:2-hydroxyacyl-CoA dehydratase [Clostridia bacterium]
MMSSYVEFTEEMKKDYTILAPNMLPLQLSLVANVLRSEGYNIELLENSGPQIPETGLKYTHNDTCYPAILVIGQFMDALLSGKYDLNKVALIYFQTGGGCRASNYISLIRKALKNAGLGHIPVISFSFAGLEKHSGFKLSLSALHRIIYAVIYGDILFLLRNQCKPYELEKGAAQAMADKYCTLLEEKMRTDGVSFKKFKANCRILLDAFAAIPRSNEKKVQVGIVGEIYVKFSPLGNNNLEQLLVDNGAEVTIPGLLDFFLYCVYNNITDYKLYRKGRFRYPVLKFVYKYLIKKQQEIIDLIKEHGVFRAPGAFARTAELIKSYMNHGCKMGEGWLLPAEMLELADSGVKNIVCTQPFGCLPNHICGKGMMKPIKDRNPDVNIVAIDYDASASKVNQENRIKLMLANAAEEEKTPAAV